MIYVIGWARVLFILSLLLVNTLQAAAYPATVNLSTSDCQLFEKIEKASRGRFILKKISGGCEIQAQEAAQYPTDRKIMGFGGVVVTVVTDRVVVRKLAEMLGPKLKIESAKKVKNTSLNEKLFSTPVFSVQCELKERTCEIIMVPNAK